ncbi:KAT8 regulatory NSL complex subunit 2 isoform X1 [Papilio machaon]|uniref:KAT8 regulatory NSL complex subunit 2 isoform X1 n=2 Tax=Papilio machaon TaxID=76193 RepID=UPI001E6654E9|nr:KAT8 regulatory NSL complex subunit 2 isoform X1 [Papilio machaon]
MFSIIEPNMKNSGNHNIRINEYKPVEISEMTSQDTNKVLQYPKPRMLSRGRGSASTIRITNVKSIKPPDNDVIKKQEEEKLRAQLQKEIMSRSRSCAYRGYVCQLAVLSGRQHCARHILHEPGAPYKQCVHTYAGGQRCNKPAPIPPATTQSRDAGLCFEHARAALYSRQRSAAPPPPVTTTETLLNQLQHYIRPERTRTTSCASSVSVVSEPCEPDLISPNAVDPFKQIDATAVNASYSSSIMECASASESDCDSVTLGPDGDCRAVHEDNLSDAEEAPCESQPLWRAGVYTAEEAVSETKTVLKSLQSAYIRQMGRLRILLQSARYQYIKSLKAEREQYCSINAQARGGPLTVRERRQLRKLKAYAGYHRKHGVDAVLARKLHRKRAKVNDSNPHRFVPTPSRCTFAEGGVRCSTSALPAAKHCLKHILHDRHQVLFAACGDERGCAPCREPVARLPLPHTCRYHADPPPYQVFTLKKDESDSDTESQFSSSGSHTDLGEQSFEDKCEAAPDAPSDALQYQ